MRCADTRVRIEFRDWKQVLRSREGRRRELEAKKKKEKGRDDPWLVFGRPFPRFVIEGVSSRSENRGALLVSADLKMYPFLSLPLSRSL